MIVIGEPWYPGNAASLSAAVADEPLPAVLPEPPAIPSICRASATSRSEPTFEDVYAQAELEHLRAKTALLKAQTAAFERSEQRKGVIELTSMSDNEFDHFIADVSQEIDRREALKGDSQ
jgi:hypothetical protein